MTFGPAVWEAPPLRGLDARARGDLQLAAARRDVAAGAFLFRAGDPADHLFVVERGALVVSDRTGKSLRRAAVGDALGEEALVFSFGARLASARAEGDACVVAVPAALLRRVWQRAGTAGHVARITRAMTRSAMKDALAASPLALDASTIEVLLDGSRLLEIARGDVVVRAGERRRGIYVVAEGVVRLENEHAIPVGHLRGGDVFIGDVAPRVVAASPSWITFVGEDVLDAARITDRAHAAARTCERAAANAHTTAGSASALADLARLETAQSLLVIDGDACVRCGFCASSCAEAHADGHNRLWRSGPVIALASFPSAILPASCQHCRAPSCLPACPTGAIARDDHGHVTLREDLCTGCGSCTKACPWENLALTPRPGGRGAEPGTSADVAVKCDLCAGSSAGPACVRACPTEAIVRVDGPRVLVEVAAALREEGAPAPDAARPLRASRTTTFAIAGLASAILALAARIGPSMRIALGVLALLGMFALTAYGALKRRPAWRRLVGQAPMHAQYTFHVALGFVTFVSAWGHAAAGNRATTIARAGLAAMIAASGAGAFGAAAFRAFPRRLSRLVREEWLPEDTAARRRALAERVAAALTGKSDLVKAVFVRVLEPYRRSFVTPLRLMVTGTVDTEVARLRALVERALEGRGGEKLEGLDALVDAVVQETCFRSARVVLFAMQAWAPLHIAAALAALLLVLVHVAAEAGLR